MKPPGDEREPSSPGFKEKEDVLKTVPMPCSREDVSNETMRAWLEDYDGSGECDRWRCESSRGIDMESI